jgi:hypothetical protein
MGLEKYISEPRVIPYSQELVFNRLSSLKNLKEFVSPDKIEELNKKGVKTDNFKLEDFEASDDYCSFKISMLGKVGIEVAEREPFKTIKFQGEKSMPFPVTFWVQLVPAEAESCKLRLTLHAELNPMIKIMVGRYLEKGIEKMADVLAAIDYNEHP